MGRTRRAGAIGIIETANSAARDLAVITPGGAANFSRIADQTRKYCDSMLKRGRGPVTLFSPAARPPETRICNYRKTDGRSRQLA